MKEMRENFEGGDTATSDFDVKEHKKSKVRDNRRLLGVLPGIGLIIEDYYYPFFFQNNQTQ